MIPASHRHALLSKDTSRQNKLWLLTAWKDRWFIEWQWRGEPMRSRMAFRFEEGAPLVDAQSFDEDVVPTFKFGSEKKS